MVDVAQDLVITEDDCGTLRGKKVTALKDNEDIVEPLSERIVGRVTVHAIYDPLTEEMICEANQEITDDLAKQIEDTNIEEVNPVIADL